MTAERPRRGPSRAQRETYRRQVIAGIGGWSGALIASIPTIVFVIVNVATTLRWGVIAAVASALLLAGYRLVRRKPVQQALSGLLGVVVAAVIAARTGQARGYFLLGIWTSFAYAVPFAVSVLVRRPLVGLFWEFLDPTEPEPDESEADDVGGGPAAPDHPVAWYRRRPLLLAYTWSSLAAVAVFLARGFVQLALYHQDATGWLAFARIAMGYPLFAAAVGFILFVVRRAQHRVRAALARERSAGQHGPA